MYAEPQRRSPAAERFDPIADRYEWVAARDCDVDDLRRHVGLGEADWARVLAHGGIFVDSRRATAGPVPRGAFVRVYRLRAEPDLPPLGDDLVLFEGGGVVAVAKPAWWSTVPTRASERLCLEAALRTRLGLPRLVAAHRLDKQTSGVLLVAADGKTAAKLHDQFRARAVDKTYVAVVSPPPRAPRFTVRGAMVRVQQVQYSRWGLVDDGAGVESHSEFEVLRTAGPRAVVRARPLTGRTHQLRVHLAASGAPIVGDTIYGPPWRPEAPASAERTQLHADWIRFAVDGRPVEVRAPLPADFVLAP